jgi:Rrf2 family transcriptional regulator, iron-sulfur cluster assembly transcription factor
MKINTQIKYGVRALCYISYNSLNGHPAQVRDISEREGISPRYIEQIFQKLKKAGIVRSVRGPYGGYYLARKPEEIKVGDIIRATEGGNFTLQFCDGLNKKSPKRCERIDSCIVKETWDEGSKRLMAYFDSITIRDLCKKSD